MTTTPPPTARFLPVLTHIQTHLDGDLSLATLAARGGLSPYHFHRQFRAAVGETVKAYTARLRLEQAAYQLKIWDAPIMDIALNAGYQSPETFSRAFRRQFGLTPRAYRRDQHISQWLGDETVPPLNHLQADVELSRTTFHKLQPLTVAFIRHLGPYTEVDAGAFDRLIAWAQRRGLYRGDNLLLGVGHDDPGITPSEQVRYDACLTVAEPAGAEGEIGFQVVPGGDFAVTTYIGPYGPTLEQAYGVIMRRLLAQSRYRVIGLPAIEIYRASRINVSASLNHTDIYLPVAAVLATN